MNFESGGHFYTKDGQPAHDADLRRARKEFLLRSVTSIDKAMFPNPALDNYKQEQMAKAAFYNQRQPHEEYEDYAKRLDELSKEHRDKAAGFGTELHDAVDKLPQMPTGPILPWVERVVAWQQNNIEVILESE